LNELALFAGAGGGILGGKLLGWRTVCAVEYDAYAASVLVARQNDGCLEPFPIWDDVRTFDGKPWRGIVDVVSGGFPCTDISAAGKGAGITGKQSGLWTEMARIVGEVRPRFVFVENSPLLVKRGLAVVLGDLAEMGYDARWGIVGAHHATAPHKRDRCWIVADSEGYEKHERKTGELACKVGGRQSFNAAVEFGREDVGHSCFKGLQGRTRQGMSCPGREKIKPAGADWWHIEPELDRVANGVAHRIHRLRAIGNGQVPAVAALAWRLLGGPSGE
jgi:DNA (cytosine-5)-methyltransferase 1